MLISCAAFYSCLNHIFLTLHTCVYFVMLNSQPVGNPTVTGRDVDVRKGANVEYYTFFLTLG